MQSVWNHAALFSLSLSLSISMYMCAYALAQNARASPFEELVFSKKVVFPLTENVNTLNIITSKKKSPSHPVVNKTRARVKERGRD